MLAEKEILDQMHRQRIDMAHGVYIIDVVNDEKYIGESTRGELDYAISKGKHVFYHSLHKNEGLTIEDLEPSINDLKAGRESPYMTTEKIILVQCGKCGYWHDNDTEETKGWVPYCDLHHGDGLAYPGSEFKPIVKEDSS